MKLQKLGGYASIFLVCMVFISSIILIPVHDSLTGLDYFDPVKMLDLNKASAMTSRVLDILLAFPFVILTLIVFLALEERLRPDAPRLMRLAVIAASIFSALIITSRIGAFIGNGLLAATNDMSAFRAFLFLREVLNLSANNVLGWGFLLIGWITIRTRKLPRILGYIIAVFGIVSILQFAFFAGESIIGLSIGALLYLIVYIWLGIHLIRNPALNLE